MRPLSDADIVRVWEYGCRASPMRRAMAVIAAANDENRWDDTELLALTPGERDVRLLSVRCNTFGPALECVTVCPSCGERLEFNAEATTLLPDADAAYAADVRPTTLAESGYRVTVRPPTIGDVEQLALIGEESLIDRCVVRAEYGGEGISAAEIPEPVIAAIDAHLGAADPAAVCDLAITCPVCAHAWTQVFDIAAFLWAEISARALRLFSEVHVLARAYGWSESEILALGTSRRQRYLELVR